MKKRAKLKRKIKILIFIVLILLLVLILALIIRRDKKEDVPYTTPKVDIIDPKNDGTLNLSGFGIFFEQFTGELKSSDIAYKLEEVSTKKIVRIYDMIKDYKQPSELETFYKNNEASIKKMVGIQSDDDFVNFAKKLQERNLNLNTWYRLDINTDTFVDSSDKDGYAYVEYTVSYKNNSTIVFTLYIAKSSTLDPQYIINIK